MKKLAKMTALLFAVGMAFSAFASCNVASSTDGGTQGGNLEEVQKGDYTTLTKLVVDGGGENRAYNTTASLSYDKYSNPYPYNTLEGLIEEWNTANAHSYGYYFELASSSINSDTEVIVNALNETDKTAIS